MLREARPSDASQLAAYQRDPRYLEHYSEPPVAAEEIVRLACQWATVSPRLNYQLIVSLGTDGRVLGSVGLRQAGYPAGEAELGVELNPLHWGGGFASEALSELIRFARRDLSLRRLWASTSPGNRRALRLLERLGFSPEPHSGPPARFKLTLTAA